MFGSVATLAFVPFEYDFRSYGQSNKPSGGKRQKSNLIRWSGWLVARVVGHAPVNGEPMMMFDQNLTPDAASHCNTALAICPDRMK
ncbi:hypothetical protein MCELHM10_03816 [Paracoccaceae bacterium]